MSSIHDCRLYYMWGGHYTMNTPDARKLDPPWLIPKYGFFGGVHCHLRNACLSNPTFTPPFRPPLLNPHFFASAPHIYHLSTR